MLLSYLGRLGSIETNMLSNALSPEKAPIPRCESDVCGSLGDLVHSYQSLVQKRSPSKAVCEQDMLREIIRQYCKVKSNQFESIRLPFSSDVLPTSLHYC